MLGLGLFSLEVSRLKGPDDCPRVEEEEGDIVCAQQRTSSFQLFRVSELPIMCNGGSKAFRGDLTEPPGQMPEVVFFFFFFTLRAWSHSPSDMCSVPDPTPPRYSSPGTVAPLRSTHTNLSSPIIPGGAGKGKRTCHTIL